MILSTGAMLVALWAVTMTGARGQSAAPAQSSAERADVSGSAEKALADATGFFREANEAALSDPVKARELYEAAALRFEYLIGEKGCRNGELHANLANTYFLAGDMGRAILNYRLALRYLPGSHELRESLAYARAQCVDLFSVSETGQIRRAMFFWHYWFSQRTRLIVFGIAYVGLWVIAAWKLLEPRRRLTAPAQICLAVSLLVGVSAALHATEEYRGRAGIVVAPEVVARKGDGYIYEPALTNALHSGAEFTLVEQRGEWVQARFSNGEEAWLPVESVAFVDVAAPAT